VAWLVLAVEQLIGFICRFSPPKIEKKKISTWSSLNSLKAVRFWADTIRPIKKIEVSYERIFTQDPSRWFRNTVRKEPHWITAITIVYSRKPSRMVAQL
jgi:hypothetical protein